MRRLSKVKIHWSPSFAYAIGLITTDGNLSPDGRHINLTSKDEEIVMNFKKALALDNKIGRKSRGDGTSQKKYFVIQFGDKNFYDFLLSVGLTPAKSKTISDLSIPIQFFPDFLRGCMEGDGNISVCRHPESSHMQLRMRLSSASKSFLTWLYGELKAQLSLEGGWISHYSVYVLTYGKNDAKKLLKYMYYDKQNYYLKRKYEIGKDFIEQ